TRWPAPRSGPAAPARAPRSPASRPGARSQCRPRRAPRPPAPHRSPVRAGSPAELALVGADRVGAAGGLGLLSGDHRVALGGRQPVPGGIQPALAPVRQRLTPLPQGEGVLQRGGAASSEERRARTEG